MGDNKKVYTKFIGYYIRSLNPLITKYQWREYLRKKIGTSIDRALEVNLKYVALTLYYTHFASMSGCVRSWDLIQKTPTKIRAFLLSSEANRKSHGMDEIPVVYYTNEPEVVKHMESFDGKVAPFREIMNDISTKPNDIEKRRVVSPKKKRTVSSPKKKISGGSNKCNDYKVTELRKMATANVILGRSKMNKAQLCKALNITS